MYTLKQFLICNRQIFNVGFSESFCSCSFHGFCIILTIWYLKSNKFSNVIFKSIVAAAPKSPRRYKISSKITQIKNVEFRKGWLEFDSEQTVQYTNSIRRNLRSWHTVKPELTTTSQYRPLVYNDHLFRVQIFVFITRSYLWTTTTCQQRPQIWSPMGGRCTQVWLYFNPIMHGPSLNSETAIFKKLQKNIR